ncbi:succinyldiaminopimelate transaminase [Thiohalomonas denitrificans]|uniref:succinyldiaminopimelate transaminase n=1 Tax=Thiohalomonas denitrificans TaxID=415747 RepID=UPI0026EE6F57|nr:succinyldiaminopimelate transaminase [Thiohalomonas denitrificans]
MNPDLEKLQPYPFEKLNSLKTGVRPPADKPHIALSIGEPKHQPPAFVIEEVITHLHGLANYPVTKGRPELRAAAGGWLTRRFGLPVDSIDPEANLLPVAGTREALFAFAQAVVDRSRYPLVLAPNPFYQIYEGAALLAGATPFFLNTTAENRFLPDLDAVTADVWQRTQLIYLCSPGNPTGAVMPVEQLQRLIRLADEHDFIIASDECYSELYFEEDAPPPGLLQAAAAMGRDDYRRCVVFHSLSKRSNLPGLRSGFVAGDRELLRRFLHYRTYQGCALPPPTQAASIVAWQDETHVKANRDLYRAKFDAVLDILQPVLDIERPDAGFYLWPKTPIADTDFTRGLFERQNVTVLPGSYLSREAHGLNPGAGRIRMALVAELDECIEAAERVRRFVESL